VAGLSPCDAARRAVTDLSRIVDSDVSFDCDETNAPGPLPVNIAVYRVVQESLTNSLKYADATTRSVRVGVVDRVVEVSIKDDGQGIDGEIDWDGATLGLAGMRERVELLGGTFSVDTGSGLGTIVAAQIPLENGVVDA
jgi:signal transduction histidine kinase